MSVAFLVSATQSCYNLAFTGSLPPGHWLLKSTERCSLVAPLVILSLTSFGLVREDGHSSEVSGLVWRIMDSLKPLPYGGSYCFNVCGGAGSVHLCPQLRLWNCWEGESEVGSLLS